MCAKEHGGGIYFSLKKTTLLFLLSFAGTCCLLFHLWRISWNNQRLNQGSVWFKLCDERRQACWWV